MQFFVVENVKNSKEKKRITYILPRVRVKRFYSSVCYKNMQIQQRIPSPNNNIMRATIKKIKNIHRNL